MLALIKIQHLVKKPIATKYKVLYYLVTSKFVYIGVLLHLILIKVKYKV